MRLVLDTNIVASGLLWNGTSAQLIDAARAEEIEIFTSHVLLAELTRILQRTKFAKAIVASGLPLDELVLGYAELATRVTPMSIPAPLFVTAECGENNSAAAPIPGLRCAPSGIYIVVVAESGLK